MYIIIISPGCKVHIIIIFSIDFATDLESAEALRDFLCIAFVVCTCVRHVHVDFFSLLLCVFLHADTCSTRMVYWWVLLFLQHFELHIFLNIKQYSQTSWCLMGNSQYCYGLANMAGYYILKNWKMRAFNIHKLCQKMYIFQIICWLQVDKQPHLIDLNNHKIYL